MSFFERLAGGLKKTRAAVFNRIKNVLQIASINEDTLEEIEELLIMGDVGMETTQTIIHELKMRHKEYSSPVDALESILIALLDTDQPLIKEETTPLVVSVVGVNGTGKTTTVGKLAHYYGSQGKEVVVAAADTFRAAAIDQLKVWALDRAKATFIAHQPGADAGAVAYDAVNHAISKKKDIVLIDTAGRLHTKHNLMEELKKTHRVVQKLIPGAPHEVWLVVDATTGQNGLIQAKKFKEAVHVSGLILTKLDGTAKGGIVLPIRREMGLPIKWVGVGEAVEDLRPFDAKDFVNALMEVDDHT